MTKMEEPLNPLGAMDYLFQRYYQFFWTIFLEYVLRYYAFYQPVFHFSYPHFLSLQILSLYCSRGFYTKCSGAISLIVSEY
ncbi:hypothetical protein HCUR_00448 [Holospora curviuscula]|uniref:Uncharacterized protein n=1 Tax=Holospora curviuscula TaxID=1082868 RepID=A0A2S5RAD2_9PROT|nr:hypothetical protein HCUR_00448 [Holospora curviuscula]